MTTDTFSREDRVIIRDVESSIDRRFIGRQGRFLGRTGIGHTGAYIVGIPNTSSLAGPIIVRAKSIDHALESWERELLSEARPPRSGRFNVAHPPLTQAVKPSVGDRVRIVAVAPQTDRIAIGKIGTVEAATPANGHMPRRFRVNVAGTQYVATQVERMGPALVSTIADQSKPETAEVLIDPKRLQAAHAAHAMLGKDVHLDDLIGVAEFILSEHKPVPRVETTAVSAPLTLEGARKATESSLSVRDLEIRRDRTDDDDVVEIDVNGETSFLTSSDIDRVIAYLAAAKVDHTAR
ncbi:hypothetical protein JOF56_003694 [Kibdelosporangium banguiense]|uniref:Uncharacterized protein n=1 Tax=Kibdelosporangium banguiense TaxID=1365924 RepID=A0ABS4TFW6_9PSEU|nr:hypothetical protein [Kibdelosporangium banguiense]MBP2323309.1 hypothetical protein [Kibdelosporangium banguiense]